MDQIISSVNFHVWEPCNMRCKFCFAGFQDVKQHVLPKGHLPKEEAIQVVNQLAWYGFKKITFAGGEPLLCPWLPDLIKRAKELGMTTMVVTNGSQLDDALLIQMKGVLDWVAISIDSLNPARNVNMGRAIGGQTPMSPWQYKTLMKQIKHNGYGLKINTVVNQYNHLEDLSEFIQSAGPLRWKVLQALPVDGQNDLHADGLDVSEQAFRQFISRHHKVSKTVKVVTESNDQMRGSYAMVDPAGRFFDNVKGTHRYSQSILNVGVASAFSEVESDTKKYLDRGGLYNWENTTVLNPKIYDTIKITLSGLAGSGKSTVGKLLAKELNVDFISVGNFTRKFAMDKYNRNINDFQDLCKNDPGLDQIMDEHFVEMASRKSSFVMDYRLGYKFIPNAFHVYLKVSDKVAAQRIHASERGAEFSSNKFVTKLKTLNQRNQMMRERFIKLYNADFTVAKNYSLVIKVDELSAEDIVIKIRNAFSKYHQKTTELQ